MSRYTQDIKDIVGVDKIKADIAELKNKPNPPPIRSVSYQSSTGNVQNATGAPGSGGISAPSDAGGTTGMGDGGANATNGNNGPPGAPGSGPGGGTGIPGDASNGVVDIADIIDSNATGDMFGGSGATLAGITGWHDCASGLDGTIRTDGPFYTPPVGWDTPNQGPEDDNWQLGKMWTVSIGPGFNGGSPAAALDSYITYLKGIFPQPYPVGYGDAAKSGTFDNQTYDIFGQVNSIIGYFYQDGTGAVSPAAGVNIARDSCIGSYCLTSSPRPQIWPTSNTFQLAPNSLTGTFKPHPMDTESPSKYSAGVSSVDMCFGSGRKARLQTGVNGVKMLFEVDPGTGIIKTGAIVRVFDSGGHIIAYGDSGIIANYTVPGA